MKCREISRNNCAQIQPWLVNQTNREGRLLPKQTLKLLQARVTKPMILGSSLMKLRMRLIRLKGSSRAFNPREKDSVSIWSPTIIISIKRKHKAPWPSLTLRESKESNLPGRRALLGSQIPTRRSLMLVLRSPNNSNGKVRLVDSMPLRRNLSLSSSRPVPSRRPRRRRVNLKLKKWRRNETRRSLRWPISTWWTTSWKVYFLTQRKKYRSWLQL